MIHHVRQAFELLMQSGELAPADAQRINILIPELDKNGSISKAQIIAQVFGKSKNPDGAYRNFLSRIQAAAVQAAENAEEEQKERHAGILGSITVSKINKSSSSEAAVQFSAQVPKAPPQITGRANRVYQEENYIPAVGSDKKNNKQATGQVGIFISYATEDKFFVEQFMKQFTAYYQQANPVAEYPVQHWSMNDLKVGENFDQIIRQSLDESDFGLTLLSEAFFDSRYITEVELKHLLKNDKLLPVGLNSKINGKNATTSQFRKHVLGKYPGEQVAQCYDTQIFYLTDRKGDFFTDCDEDGQAKFIRELYAQIQGRAAQQEKKEKQKKLSVKKEICCYLDAGRKGDYRCEEYITSTGKRGRISTAGEGIAGAALDVLQKRLEKITNQTKEEISTYEALEDMFDWLEHSDSGLYALLGDYGMGKTFTCRMFARKLADQCQGQSDLPKPIYMDLRDVPTFVTVNGVTGQPTLEEMLTTVLRFSGQEADYSADELIAAARQGKQLLIFDGLDEKLVYYTADMRTQFLSELLRVFPQTEQAGVKIVISCRTHHFETISQMNNFLLGLNRSGLRSEDYRVLHLLPFSSSQILQLLTKLLGTEDANRVFSFIDNEAYLKDLAHRPFILKQLSGTLPELQDLKNQGLPVNAASFYQALIKDNISRDDEKHIIKPRHKQQLLTDLAAAFWQDASQRWEVDQLNDWFCEWLEDRPSLAAQYRNEDSRVLEKDLRNSTLLVRFDEQDFGFSHSSMQEFFLSKWLVRQWRENTEFSIDQPISELTHQFMLDNLALLTGKEQRQLNQGLAVTLARPWSPTSDLALTIIREQAEQGLPVPKLGIVDLRTAYLSNRRIRGLQGEKLLFDRVEANNSQWLDCHFQWIEVESGNISESLWRDCSWQEFDSGETSRPEFFQRATIVNCQGKTNLPKQHLFSYPKKEVADTSPSYVLSDWQQGHSSIIGGCAFSPDGSRILSAAFDKTLKLWDLEGYCLRTLLGHEDAVLSCAFSPDGSRILSAAFDSTLKLWDLEGNCIQTMQGHEDEVQSCAFSPNGSRILSAAFDKTLKLWDLKGNCLRTLLGHEGGVNSCAFNPDGSRILSASDDSTLKLWDLEGNCIQTMQGHEGRVMSCAFSPDGSRILSAQDKTFKIWDLEGHCLKTLLGHEDGVLSCAFSPNGNRILSAAVDSSLKLWDLEGNCLRTLLGHEDEVTSHAFSPDGSRILAATDDSTLKLWDSEGHCLRTMQRHEGGIWSCASSPDGSLILSAARDSMLRLWDRQGKCLRTIRGHTGWVMSCAFSPDGSRILSAADDSTLRLWDLKGNCIQTIQGHESGVLSCAFNPDGSRILSAADDSTLRLWDLEGNCIQIMQGHEGRVRGCAFSPDGSRILSAAVDSTLRLWDRQGKFLRTMQGHTGWVMSCAFSPDGSRILSASRDSMLRLWDLEGNCLTIFQGHKSGVWHCAFSPDGSRILSAADDSTLKLWDLKGNCIKTMQEHEGGVKSCAFSPDGKHLLSAADDGLRLWRLDGTVERIFSAWNEQWYTAFFNNNQLEKIIGTEMSWKMANLAKDGKTWHMDELDCFEWVPAEY